MSKTIRFKENSLIAIKEKLNEIMAGNDAVVSPNDIVTLWHGTDVPGIVGILKSGAICAREGVQHGETYGMNWFSLKKVNNFNKGIVFSIEVPSSDFKTKFKMMNSSEAITRDDRLDISQYNLKIEMFCTFGREQLNRYYDLIVEKGEHYPIETIRDKVFYKWCEKSGNEDVYMSTSDYDLGLILSNILGEDKVRAEGFLEENTKLNEAAPEVDEYTICGEEEDGENVAGGNYFHVAESIDFDNNGMSINDDKILGKYNLKDLILSKTGNYVTLNKIIANELGKGNGSRFMEELTRMADKNGWTLALTPDTSFGGSSVGRLKKFYKRFGFVPNKGRSTDFNTRESMIRKPLGENKEYKNILTESQESKSIAAAKKLVMQRLGYNEQEADEFIRIKLRNDIPSLRTPQGGKFILGVARMFCDGELRSANDMGNLNSTLKLVASDAHINEYDRNLNGLSAQELVQRFAKAMSDNLEAEKTEINQMVFDTPSDYEIVRIDSFEQAEEYGDYVSWCVTHYEGMFDSYTSDGINQFYFCLKNGFENVDEQPGDGCPLDEYGLSMIAVSVNENGMLNTCTCRWNHDNGGNDNIMDAKEVSQVIGMNFFEVFKPNNKWKELLANVEQRLANGEDPEDVFDDVYSFKEGFAKVKFNGKQNFINQEGRIISDQWFDSAFGFNEGFAVVRLNEKYNFINQEGRLINDQWFDGAYDFRNGFARVELNEKLNLINQEGRIISDQWFYKAYDFINNGFAWVKLNGKHYRLDANGNLAIAESKNKNKKILVSESRLKTIKENIESEVESSEIDLSSFKKRDTLPPGIWKDEDTLNSKVRLKLLDIADDFWEFVNLTWVEPKGIIITGSICNFNWSKFSDIDLHLIVDFNEIDEKTEFVKQYLDSKKNEWNTEHEGLKIMGFPVELYVQNISDNVEAGGIYDLEENAWIRRPNPHTIKSIGLNKFNIKDKAAEIMTIIDDMYDKLSNTTDGHEIEEIGDDAHYLWDKVKDMRKKSLSKNGESGSGNIVYKVLRRTGYLDKLFKLFSRVYDRSNSISESMKKYLTVLKEEVAIDGSSENNPYEKRWKAEREALKSFVANYGKLMQSKEDNKGGKLYKVYFDETMSNLIGYNYCICVQWNEQEMKPGSTVYIRALDRFTPFIRRNLQFDTRGRDNMRGTYDDNRFVRESVDELNLYHSSYSNFDKFNHRKYLSSGAGSQTFGWGTYLTDSFPIAESYAGKFIWQKFNEFVVSAEPENYVGGTSQYNDEIVKEACRLYRSIVRTRIVFTYGIERKYSRNFFDCEFEVTGDPAEEYDNMMKKYEEFKQFLKAGLEKQAVKVTPPSDEQMRNAFSVMNSGGDMLDTPRDEYIATTTRRNSVNSLVKLIINNIWDAADNHVKKESYIYEVEIPDDNGYNYLDYSNPVSPETAKLISGGVMKLYRRFGNKINTNRLDNAVEECLNGRMRGKNLYEELTSALGRSEKATSLFLNQCGIVGIKYRAGTIYGLPDGADENSLNYVIFDANNVRITSKNLFTDNF